MDKELRKACVNGDVAALHQLLNQDPLLLDTLTFPSVQETPLHIASLLGHVDFAAEVLKLKPGFARVRDGRGSYPLHLASAKGHAGVVSKLLKVDPSSSLRRDVDGLLPIHLAAANNHVHLLNLLLPANMSFSEAVTEQGETVLHVSVKHNQFEAAKFIVESRCELINVGDYKGNTALHLATARRQIQVMKLLLQQTTIEPNAKNVNGYTALDILLQFPSNFGDMEICEMLMSVGGRKGQEPYPVVQQDVWTDQRRSRSKLHLKDDGWSKDMQNTLLIVATLIACITFLKVLNPPWGIGESDAYLKLFFIFDMTAFCAAVTFIVVIAGGLPLKRENARSVSFFSFWLALSSMILAFTMGVNLLSEKSSVLKASAYLLLTWLVLMANLFLRLSALVNIYVRWVLKAMNSCFEKCSESKFWVSGRDVDSGINGDGIAI